LRVEETIFVDAGAERVWDVISDLSSYPGWMAGVTRWQPEGRKRKGAGARYLMRLQVGSAQVGSLIEVVEWDPPGDIAWTSVTGLDQRGRWRLRERRGEGTQVMLRLSYQSPGGILAYIADRVSSPMVRRLLRETLRRLKRNVEGGQIEMTKETPGLRERALTIAGQGLHTAKTLYDAGLIRAQRPDRTIRALIAMQRWGLTPAAGYEAGAAQYPNDVAIVDELGSLTFKEVNERTNRLASSLADAGIGEGHGVGVMCRNHRGFIEATVALSKLGATSLFLNTQFAGPQLTEVAKREKPTAIIYDEEFAELLEDAAKRRKRFVAWHDSDETADPTLDELIEQGDPAEPVPPQESGRAIILTSGTTGTPKGATRKQPETIGPIVSLLSKIPLKAREKTFIVAPLFHSWGFAHFSLGLPLGSTLILRRKFDPEQTLAWVERYRVQSAPMVPVMVQRIMELPKSVRQKYDTSSLTSIPLSGSALPGELAIKFMDEFGDILYNLYGSTEVAWATIATPDDLRAAPGTAGAPPRGTIIQIYDERGRELPRGETGRIFVGNEMLFEGYTGGGGKDVIDGLMSTGDVGYLDESNRLFVVGRDDEMIVSGGENVFPREVEDLIAKMKGVGEVAIIGVDDEKFGQRLKAYVAKEASDGPGESDIKQYVKSNLAGYKVPREVEFVKELPRNATGKVLKRELKEMHEGGASGSSSSGSKKPSRGRKTSARG
jgi:acyl-CoA synthetase (AMP-forming)/AMP-acid ligase II/ribosome-associated toxin RatA of RatAB toxin-antitoxin module